jgi:hypothetical protein
MSGNEPLDRAVRALRETGETPEADVARTRARVLDTLQRGERRGRRTFWVLLPIAAVLATSTALARNTEVGRRAWTAVAEAVGIAPPAPRSLPPVAPRRGLAERSGAAGEAAESRAAVPPPEGAAAPAPVEKIAEPETEPGAFDHGAPGLGKELSSRSSREAATPSAMGRRPRGSVPAPAVPVPTAVNPLPEATRPEAPAASAPNEAEVAALELYKNAYRLHFVEQRYRAALAAWDEYLRSAPAGRLVVEARYNRAIALARLGRRAEAEAALTPFARGEVSGGYRAQEARDLLDALRATTP